MGTGLNLQQTILEAFRTLDPNTLFRNREEFTAVLQQRFQEAGVRWLIPY